MSAASAPGPSAFWKDLTERVLATFVQGVVGGLIVTELSDQSMWLSAVSGGVAAVASLLKCIAGRQLGNRDSASLSKKV